MLNHADHSQIDFLTHALVAYIFPALGFAFYVSQVPESHFPGLRLAHVSIL